MTERELRDKIVNIAISTVWKDCYGDEIVIDRAVAEQFADSLIAAGLMFDGEYKKLYEDEKVISQSLRGTSWQFKGWYEEQKRRAEVVERAARDLIAYYCGYTIQKDIDNSLRVALQQAEEELAEGKKND